MTAVAENVFTPSKGLCALAIIATLNRTSPIAGLVHLSTEILSLRSRVSDLMPAIPLFVHAGHSRPAVVERLRGPDVTPARRGVHCSSLRDVSEISQRLLVCHVKGLRYAQLDALKGSPVTFAILHDGKGYHLSGFFNPTHAPSGGGDTFCREYRAGALRTPGVALKLTAIAAFFSGLR
jgi:hypothetical protein